MQKERVKVLVTQSCPELFNPVDCRCQAPLSMGFSRQEYWSQEGWLGRGCQEKEFTHIGKKNTGADGHSLLQEIFLIQGLSPGLLHCRQILYH